jgi:hypothetical protein
MTSIGTSTEGTTMGGSSVTGAPGSVGQSGQDAAACVTVWVTSEMFVAMLVDEVVLLCVTGPSSPGLNTRIEMFVLHIEHGAGGGAVLAGAWVLESQPQFQFQIQALPGPVGGGPGLDSLDVPPQSQFQFQTQVSGESVGSCD